jgi:hypothetical protein
LKRGKRRREGLYGTYTIKNGMNHLHPEDGFALYTKEELTSFGDRLSWGVCAKCEASIITGMHGIDFFEVVKLKGFDSSYLPTGTKNAEGKYQCHSCSKKESDAFEAKMVPRYAKRLIQKVVAEYKCPMWDCKHREPTKQKLLAHLVERHDSFHMESQLGIKHRGEY